MSELFFENKKLGFGLMRLPLLDENDGAIILLFLAEKFSWQANNRQNFAILRA